jgi:hypothetical protein
MYNTKCLTEIEYEPHGDEIGFLSYFHHEKMFSVKPKATPLDFESKLDIFQNLKKYRQHHNV